MTPRNFYMKINTNKNPYTYKGIRMKKHTMLLAAVALLQIGSAQASIIGHVTQTTAPVAAKAFALAMPQMRGYITDACISKQEEINQRLAQECDYLTTNNIFDLNKQSLATIELNQRLLKRGLAKTEQLKQLQKAYNDSKNVIEKAFTISNPNYVITHNVDTGAFTTHNDQFIKTIAFTKEHTPTEQLASDLENITNGMRRIRDAKTTNIYERALLQPEAFLTTEHSDAIGNFIDAKKAIDRFYQYQQ